MGRPLVLLHEGLGSVELWKKFPQTLASALDRRVVAYSRRGHGRSMPLDEPRGPDFLHREADVLRRFLKAQGLVDAVLIGHSDGGSIALIYASRHETSGLVLLAPHVFVEAVSLDGIRETRRKFENTDLATRLGRFHDDARHTFYGWHDIWTDPTFRTWNIEREVRNIAAPILVIQGRRDQYGSPAQYNAIAAAAPQTDLLILGHCGHSPYRDRPDAVIDSIAGFLRSFPQGRR